MFDKNKEKKQIPPETSPAALSGAGNASSSLA